MKKAYHTLKIDPCFFNNIVMGRKKFEVRKNDRDFQVGDGVKLHHWENNMYNGRYIVADIEYIHTGMGMQDGYVILGLCNIKENR